MTRHVTATQARREFFKLMDWAEKPGFAISISRDGVPKVMLVSVEEFEGLLETLEIAADKKLSAKIDKRMRELKTGKAKTIPWKKVKKELNL